MTTVAFKKVTVLKLGSALDVFGPLLSAEARKSTHDMSFIMPTKEDVPSEEITPGDSLIFTGTVTVHASATISDDDTALDIIAKDVAVFRMHEREGRYIFPVE